VVEIIAYVPFSPSFLTTSLIDQLTCNRKLKMRYIFYDMFFIGIDMVRNPLEPLHLKCSFHGTVMHLDKQFAPERIMLGVFFLISFTHVAYVI
jgi:hypothetical protein